MKALWLALALALASPAHAASGFGALKGEAARLMNRGEWAAAADAGRRQNDAVGLAVAAHCTLVRAVFQSKSKEDAERLLDAADRDIAAANAKDPDNYLVRLATASAIGYRATLTKSRKMSSRSRDIMVSLTKVSPERPEAWIAYGTWNGEVLLRVGPMLGSMVLGASRAKMEQSLASGFARDPASPLAPGYRGLLLARLGDAVSARPFLAQAVSLRPRDAYEAMVRRDAGEVIKLIDAGEPREAKVRAERLAAFGWLRAMES